MRKKTQEETITKIAKTYSPETSYRKIICNEAKNNKHY